MRERSIRVDFRNLGCQTLLGILTMLQAFIDETGNDPTAFAFNFAGWIGTVQEWKRFSTEWAEELQRPPAIKYFKHSEAKHLSGEFAGLSREEGDRKILGLATVIAERDVYGVIAGMKHSVLQNILRDAVPPPGTVRSMLHANRPYDFCFHAIVTAILQIQLEAAIPEPVDFVFDEGDSAFEDCVTMYRQLREMLPTEMRDISGTVTTSSDKIEMPLQAADLLAGQATVQLRGFPIEEPHKLLAGRKKIYFTVLTGNDPLLLGYSEIVTRMNIGFCTRIW